MQRTGKAGFIKQRNVDEIIWIGTEVDATELLGFPFLLNFHNPPNTFAKLHKSIWAVFVEFRGCIEEFYFEWSSYERKWLQVKMRSYEKVEQFSVGMYV